MVTDAYSSSSPIISAQFFWIKMCTSLYGMIIRNAMQVIERNRENHAIRNVYVSAKVIFFIPNVRKRKPPKR